MIAAGRSLVARKASLPGLSRDDVGAAAAKALNRCSVSNMKRNGSGVTIMWFRNDLRLLDNEALHRAWTASDAVLPVYCLDPRHFGTTHYFGFPKTGALRAKFLLECLEDLRNNLIARGLNLMICQGKPEELLPSLARIFGAHTIFAHKETCSEELHVERLIQKGLKEVKLPSRGGSRVPEFSKLQLIWGSTMYHIDDLPFDARNLPDVYTQFRRVRSFI